MVFFTYPMGRASRWSSQSCHDDQMCRPTEINKVMRVPHSSAGRDRKSRRVVIDVFRRQENLQIAQQMTNDEAEQDHAGDGHDGFFPNSRLPEPQTAGREIYRSSAHGMCWPFCVL